MRRLIKRRQLNKREDELKQLMAENQDARTKLQAKRHELEEKLSKLKAIAGA